MAFDSKAFRNFLSPKKMVVETPEVILDLPSKLEEVEVKEEVVESIVEEIVEENKEEKEDIQIVTEKEEFEALNLSKNELLELKKIAFADILQEDITISELVDLVLLSKSGKEIKSKNRDSLIIREYVDIKGKITTKGKVYLEEETTKNRLREILQ
jgi:hypothetical protein